MKAQLLNWPFLVAICSGLVSAAVAQGTFRNLDFEEGIFVPTGGDPFPYLVEAGPALAGWVPYIGTNQIDAILHNAGSLSFATVAIFGPDDPSPDFMHGHYFLVLQNSFPLPSDTPAIEQTGMVPGTAKSVRFLSNQFFGGIGVSFAGQGIGLALLEDLGNNRYIWGADISPFAGQTGALGFFGAGYLDNIYFSSEPIPEPSTLGLFALGVFFVFWRLRRIRFDDSEDSD